MQLSDKFAATFKAGDRIEYTDEYNNRHNVILESFSITDSVKCLGYKPDIANMIGVIAIPIGDNKDRCQTSAMFMPGVVKLHSFKRAKEVVKVGDKLNGIDPTKIVPIGTTAEIKDSLIAFDWTMFWSGEWWIVVRSDDLVGEVGDRFLPNELSDPYVLTVASVPR